MLDEVLRYFLFKLDIWVSKFLSNYLGEITRTVNSITLYRAISAIKSYEKIKTYM